MFKRILSSVMISLLTVAAVMLALNTPSASPAQAHPTVANTYTVGGVCGATIQACINYAGAGDTILIPAGTYFEHLYLSKGVSLIGAGADVTIVRSDSANSKPLMIYGSTTLPAAITSTTVISGLTLTGGNSSTAGGGIGLQMYLSPTIQNVIVTGNTASSGGGIGIAGGASATFINVVITGNLATGAFSYGGGGLLMAGNSVQLINTLIADNQDGSGHGQIEVSGGTANIVHATIANASSSSGAGIVTTGGTAIVTDSIVTSHTYGFNNLSGNIVENYNLFFGNTINRQGVISGSANDVMGDPAFVDPASGNYRIFDTSVARDTGINAGVASDFDGDARPFGPGFDIGCDEHRVPAITITTPLANQIVSSTWLLVAGTTAPADHVPHVDVSIDNGASWMTAVGTTAFAYTWTVPLEDGVAYAVRARVTDRTHNMTWSAPLTITIDRVAPQTSITDPVIGQIIRAHAYTFMGTVHYGLGVGRTQVSTDNGVTWSDVNPNNDQWSFNWSIPDEDGMSHLLRVAASDVAGNFSAPPSTVAVFVDNVPPQITFNNLPVGGETTILSDAFTVIGISTGALTTTLDSGNGPEVVEVVDNVFTHSLSLITGTYTLRGAAIDAAGNSSAITTTLIVTPYLPVPHRAFLPLIFRNFDPNRDTFEPDNMIVEAKPIAADGVLQQRNFYPLGDVDWVRLNVGPGTYIVATSGLAPNTDTVLRLYASNGVTKLAENDDCTPFTRASCLTWTVGTSSTLSIQVTPYDNASIGPNRWYDLSVVRQ